MAASRRATSSRLGAGSSHNHSSTRSRCSASRWLRVSLSSWLMAYRPKLPKMALDTKASRSASSHSPSSSEARALGTKSISRVLGSARRACSTALEISQKVWLPSALTRSRALSARPKCQGRGRPKTPRMSTSEASLARPQACEPTTVSSTTQGRRASQVAARRSANWSWPGLRGTSSSRAYQSSPTPTTWTSKPPPRARTTRPTTPWGMCRSPATRSTRVVTSVPWGRGTDSLSTCS